MERKINIEAAKKLAKRYADITLEELEDLWFFGATGSEIMYAITGFGSEKHCCLCQEAEALNTRNGLSTKCSHCIYGDEHDILQCVYTMFYREISHAKCPEELLGSLKNRSRYIMDLVEKWENMQ